MNKHITAFVKAITFGGADFVYYEIKKIIVINRVKKILKMNSEINLEIGAGEKEGKNGWVTLDIGNKSDISWNLKNGIPFPDESINRLYSSHLFEHLNFKQITLLLKECRRVLARGGIFMICVPNARLYLEAYVNRDSAFWDNKPDYWVPAFHNTGTRLDWVNYVAYMDDEHKYMFDEETLLWLLTNEGFTQVQLRSFDPTIDEKKRHHESLYAMGVKV